MTARDPSETSTAAQRARGAWATLIVGCAGAVVLAVGAWVRGDASPGWRPVGYLPLLWCVIVLAQLAWRVRRSGDPFPNRSNELPAMGWMAWVVLAADAVVAVRGTSEWWLYAAVVATAGLVGGLASMTALRPAPSPGS